MPAIPLCDGLTCFHSRKIGYKPVNVTFSNEQGMTLSKIKFAIPPLHGVSATLYFEDGTLGFYEYPATPLTRWEKIEVGILLSMTRLTHVKFAFKVTQCTDFKTYPLEWQFEYS